MSIKFVQFSRVTELSFIISVRESYGNPHNILYFKGPELETWWCQHSPFVALGILLYSLTSVSLKK